MASSQEFDKKAYVADIEAKMQQHEAFDNSQ